MSYHARSFSVIRCVVFVAMMLVSSLLAQAAPLTEVHTWWVAGGYDTWY